MKFPTAAFLTAFVASASLVSAKQCTAAQLESLQVDDSDKAFETACPALFKEGAEVLDPTDESSFTKEALEALAPCKAATCTTYLTKLTDSTPDCDVLGINVKELYGAVLTLCKKFASGTVSDADLEKIFEDVIGQSPLLEIGATNSTGNSTSTSNSTSPTTTPSQPDKDSVPAVSSMMPSPAPTATKSSATVVTGIAAVATASIVSAFLV